MKCPNCERRLERTEWDDKRDLLTCPFHGAVDCWETDVDWPLLITGILVVGGIIASFVGLVLTWSLS